MSVSRFCDMPDISQYLDMSSYQVFVFQWLYPKQVTDFYCFFYIKLSELITVLSLTSDYHAHYDP